MGSQKMETDDYHGERNLDPHDGEEKQVKEGTLQGQGAAIGRTAGIGEGSKSGKRGHQTCIPLQTRGDGTMEVLPGGRYLSTTLLTTPTPADAAATLEPRPS